MMMMKKKNGQNCCLTGLPLSFIFIIIFFLGYPWLAFMHSHPLSAELHLGDDSPVLSHTLKSWNSSCGAETLVPDWWGTKEVVYEYVAVFPVAWEQNINTSPPQLSLLKGVYCAERMYRSRLPQVITPADMVKFSKSVLYIYICISLTVFYMYRIRWCRFSF